MLTFMLRDIRVAVTLLVAVVSVSAAAQEKIPVLGFAGGLATLGPPFVPWSHVCFGVKLFATGTTTVPSAVVAVEGLGQSTLSNGSWSGRCDGPDANEAPTLEVHGVNQMGRWFQVRVPANAFPRAGQLDGRLRVYVEKELPLDMPIHLQASASNPFFQALAWFLGIAIPGTLTYFAGRAAFEAQKRSEALATQRANFRQYVSNHRKDLETLFVDFLPRLCRDEKNAAEWCKQMKVKLEEHLSVVPLDRQEKLVAALNNSRRDEAVSILAAVYSEWAPSIRSCR